MADAEAATPDIDALFMETVRGRYPLAEGPSTARFWAPTQETVDVSHKIPGSDPAQYETVTKDVEGRFVPRPDRSLVVLQALTLFGLLGLDHFYLRSTKTGIIKLLTFGGLGIWWLWDMLQLWTESKRVLNYGLTGPFDLFTGIGQGMITNEGTKYSQNTSWMGWAISTILGIGGMDYFYLGRFVLGLRFLLIALIGVGPLIKFIADTQQSGFLSALINTGFIGFFVILFFGVLLVVGVMPTWLTHLWTLLFDPDHVMTDGLKTPSVSIDAFRWYHRMYRNSKGEVYEPTADEYNQVRTAFDPTEEGITPEELKKRFWIGRNESISFAKESLSTWPQFTLIYRMFAIVCNAIGDALKAVWFAVNPGAAIAEESMKALRGKGAAAASIGSALGGAAGTMGSLLGGKAPDLASIAGGKVPHPADLAGSLLGGKVPGLADLARKGIHVGGARAEPLSTESKIIAAVLTALIGGGAVKAAVDYIAPK